MLKNKYLKRPTVAVGPPVRLQGSAGADCPVAAVTLVLVLLIAGVLVDCGGRDFLQVL